MIKKTAIAFIIVLTFIMNSVFVKAADSSSISGLGVKESAYDKAKFTLSAVKVMTENEYDSFQPSKNVTRAEFTEIIAKIKSAENAEYNNNFYDVPTFYGYIGFAVDAGYMNGYTDDTFRPDNYITYREAVTVMIKMLGYDVIARGNGGYPDGYLSQAAKLGIFDSTNISMDDNATRAGLAVMLYNAMDVKVLTESGSSSNYTLLDERMDNLGLKFSRGIITGVDGVTVDGSYIRNNEILIDGSKYCFEQYARTNEYLGAEIEFYYSEEENTVAALRKIHHDTLVIEADNIISTDTDTIRHYENERQNKEKRAKVSQNAGYIYNHRSLEQFDGSEADIDNGTLTLVDINRDGYYDLVIIDEYVSFVIDDINYEDNLIYLKDRLLNEKPYVKINRQETKHETYLLDRYGNFIGIEDIKANGTVCIYRSIDGSYVKIINVDEYVEGAVSFINSDEMKIGEDTYKIAVGNDLPLINSSDIKLGQIYKFCLDINGKIFAIKDDSADGDKYGFIANIADDLETGEKVYVKIAEGRTYREGIDTTKDIYDIKRNQLAFSNSQYFTAELSEKLKLNGKSIAKEKILDFIHVGDAVAYRISGDKISSLTPLLAHGEEGAVRTLHYKTKTFGGDAGGAFFFDQRTVFVVNPLNKSENKNFLTRLEYANGDKVTVTGYDVDDETKIAKMAVITTNKDYYDYSGSVTANSRIGIVKKVVYELNKDGDPAYKISGYNNDEELMRYCLDTPELNGKASKLKTGDIIYYFPTNGGGNIGDISFIDSLENAEFFEPVISGAGSTSTEKVYGKLYGLKRHTLLDDSEMSTDIITVSITGDGSDALEYYVPDDIGKPSYFIYDPQKKSVQPFEDNVINSVQSTDLENADNVFVYKYGDDVKAVVFVKGGNR